MCRGRFGANAACELRNETNVFLHQTLLKPNGGFIFDGNKALLELECKSYKVVFEESVKLPEVTEENPFPTIHTSPFSVGGFAWQV